jgi:hypothetical protein
MTTLSTHHGLNYPKYHGLKLEWTEPLLQHGEGIAKHEL